MSTDCQVMLMFGFALGWVSAILMCTVTLAFSDRWIAAAKRKGRPTR
jgi:hypothetical protein